MSKFNKMKKFFIILLLTAFGTAFAQEDQKLPITDPVSVGDSYGEGVSDDALKTAVTAEQLEKMLNDSDQIEDAVVYGTVTEVCPKKGCWVTIDTESDQRFFVKMKDYGFFVSTDLKGKNIVLQGKAENKSVSVEEMQHYAEDAGKSEEEIAAITEPGKEVRFLASGIRVVE